MSAVNMDDYGKIRLLGNGGVTSQRKMAKEVGKARQTVKKYKDGAVLPGQKQTRDRAPSVLTDDVVEYVRDRLAESEAFPGKMKHSSGRINDLLVQDMGFEGGKSTVRGPCTGSRRSLGKGSRPSTRGSGSGSPLKSYASYAA